MKKKAFFTGILSLLLVFGMTLFVGCPADDGGGGPATVTATVVALTATAGAAQPGAIDHTQYSGTVVWTPQAATFVAGTAYTATITLAAKSGWTFDGVAAGALSVTGAILATPNAAGSGAFAVTITPTAGAAPAPGADASLLGVWIGSAGGPHYKFVAADGGNVYYTANATAFNIAGTYSTATNAALKEVTLRPNAGGVKVVTYEITKSLLKLDDAGNITSYTKNPETGGGFNGSPGVAPLGGMWKEPTGAIGGATAIAFNSDLETFVDTGRRNKDNKVWWDVVGTYAYDAGQKEVLVRLSGGGTMVLENVTFKTANQIMEVTYNGAVISLSKVDDL
jgi:hypothetical protein